MSAVLKKGAPSRSYPSKQRKLGPAPFASFEDLSDELESPGGAGGEETSKVNVMPEIKEDRYNEYRGAMGSCQSPTQGSTTPGGDEDTPVAVRSHRNVTATSSASTVTFAPSYSAPTSGPTSGLQTPSTPRIDISCASSSTPPSDESASEKELFQGGLGFAFHEEAVDDLRSSTEELDLGEEEISSEEERRRKRLEEQELTEQEFYRRSSHPANIFSRKPSVPAAPPPPIEDNSSQQRKPSAHSLFLEGLLNRPCRHASFGHGDYMRPGAVSSLSTHSAGSGIRSRSPSPNKIMFETSFCGAKPIPTKSMEADSPPKDKKTLPSTSTSIPKAAPSTLSTKSLAIKSYSQPQSAITSGAVTPTTPGRLSEHSAVQDDSRSLKSPSRKQLVITPSWERDTELEKVCYDVAGRDEGYAAAGPKDIDSISRSKTPLSPQPSSLGFDSRRPSSGRRSVSPHILLETSFCGSRPIPTRSMEVDSPPKDLPDLTAILAECNRLSGGGSGNGALYCQKTVTAQVHHQQHRHSCAGDRSSVISKDDPVQQQQTQKVPLQRKSDAGHYNLGGGDWNYAGPYLPGSPESPKSSDLWAPISPRAELRSPAFNSAVEMKYEDACSISSPQGGGVLNSSSHPASTISPISTKEDQDKNKQISKNGSSSIGSKQVHQNVPKTPGSSSTGGGSKSVGFQSEKSESSKEQDDEDAEITTEMKISEDPTVTVEDVPIESKGLFFQTDSFDEEGDLPYVPTTLPMEKASTVSIIPVSERKRLALMLNTVPVQRPKVNRPAAPATLNDYIEHSKNSLPRGARGSVSSIGGTDGGGSGGGGSSGGEDSNDVQQPAIAKMKINLPREDSLTNSSGGKGKGQRKSLTTTTWTDFANLGLLSPREIRRKMKEENGAIDDISSYHSHSDSSSTNDIPGVVDGATTADDDAESLLKLPKVPFAMDLDVHSNRSSVISQDEVQKSPSECSALLGTPDEPDTPHATGSKKSSSHHD